MSEVPSDLESEIERLQSLAEEDIQPDESIPEDLSILGEPLVGKFYKPIKKPITIRLDADVIAWFKNQPGRYQTKINGLLRNYMVQQRKKTG